MEAAWGSDKYHIPTLKLKYGTIPHIGLEFFGLGRLL